MRRPTLPLGLSIALLCSDTPGQEPARMATGTPNSWFQATKLYLGDLPYRQTRSGVFTFANPTGKRQRFKNLHMSIQCTKVEFKVGDREFELTRRPVSDALYEIARRDGKTVRRRTTWFEIGPKDRGTVRVFMTGWGRLGRKDAALSVSTTDPGLEYFDLKFQGRVTRHFYASPEFVDFGTIKKNEQRPFRFVIRTASRSDFELRKHTLLPDFIRITSKKKIVLPDGTPAWQVDGLFGSRVPPGHVASEIRFDTSLPNKSVRLEIRAKPPAKNPQRSR